MRRPAFATEEIDRQREQALSALKVSYQDPDYVAAAVIDRLVFGFHPYGLPGNGTPESLASITRDDLVAFHKRWFAPNNALLAIVGDVTSRRPWPRWRSALRRLGARRGAGVAPFDPPEPTRRVVVVDRPGACRPRFASASSRIRAQAPRLLRSTSP